MSSSGVRLIRADETLDPIGSSAMPDWLGGALARAHTTDEASATRYRPPANGAGRPSSVLMLFGPGPRSTAAEPPLGDGVDLVFIERASTMRTHAGQIAFPGGGAEPGDVDDADTALREAAEEIGLDRSGVTILGDLPSLFIPRSGFVVTTQVGWWERPGPIRVQDPGEVAQVISVPVAHLLDPATRVTVTARNLGSTFPAYRGGAFWLTDELLLWGFTAGLVDRLIDLAGLAVDWDESRETPLPERFLGARRS